MNQPIEQDAAELVSALMKVIGYPPIKNGNVTLHFDGNGVCGKVTLEVTRQLRQTARPAGR